MLIGRYERMVLQPRCDERGGLVPLESMHNVPFDIKRVYYLYGTQVDVRRGLHAHRRLKQLAICVSGSCTFLVDDGKTKEIIQLQGIEHALYIEGFIWREMFDFSPDCVLLVLADAYYDEADYIRNYADFRRLIKGERGEAR